MLTLPDFVNGLPGQDTSRLLKNSVFSNVESYKHDTIHAIELYGGLSHAWRRSKTGRHFGAFAVRHGKSNEHATVFLWSAKGTLLTYHFIAPNSEKISFNWINERMIRFQFGQSSKVVRLNEDDRQKVTEL